MEYDLNNIMLITDSFSDKDFRAQTRNKKIKRPVYSLLDNKLGLTLENKDFVFLFVLTPGYSVTKMFVLLLETPDDTETYLDEMLAYIKRKNH